MVFFLSIGNFVEMYGLVVATFEEKKDTLFLEWKATHGILSHNEIKKKI